MRVKRNDQLGVGQSNDRTPEICFGIAEVMQAVDSVLHDIGGADQEVTQWGGFGDGWRWIGVRRIDNCHG